MRVNPITAGIVLGILFGFPACGSKQETKYPVINGTSKLKYDRSMMSMMSALPEAEQVIFGRAIEQIIMVPEGKNCTPESVMAHLQKMATEKDFRLDLIRKRLAGRTVEQIVQQAGELDCDNQLSLELPNQREL